MDVSHADQTGPPHKNLVAMACCPDENEIEMPTQKMSSPGFNETSIEKNMVFIETTSPLASPGEIITPTYEQISNITDDNITVDRCKLLGSTHNEWNLQKETERLWNWCKRILFDFAKKPEAKRFLEPVAWAKLGLPLYPNIIKNPMDLGTVKDKMDRAEYSGIYELDKDMRLIWSNARKFNQPGSNIYKSAEHL